MTYLRLQQAAQIIETLWLDAFDSHLAHQPLFTFVDIEIDRLVVGSALLRLLHPGSHGHIQKAVSPVELFDGHAVLGQHPFAVTPLPVAQPRRGRGLQAFQQGAPVEISIAAQFQRNEAVAVAAGDLIINRAPPVAILHGIAHIDIEIAIGLKILLDTACAFQQQRAIDALLLIDGRQLPQAAVR